VHDFAFDAGRLFIVMELVPGKDLKTLIKERKRFPVAEACYLISQACAAIDYAHRANIIHCDIKPHNFIVTPDHRLKVTDFGIARALTSINPDERSDEVWGSPQYFSPEQAAGLAPSPASDVYSLGVVLYEMLTGQLPFNGSDPQELARQHREARPIPPRRLTSEIPAELEFILLKVLSKDPAQRYGSAGRLGRVLAPFSGFTNGLQPVPTEAQSEPAPGFTTPAANRPTSRPTQPPPQAWSQPAPAAQTSPEEQAYAEPVVPTLFSPDIIILGIVAIVLWVGMLPFGAYVLLRLGLIGTP
jgi:serine/threonine protein kinase